MRPILYLPGLSCVPFCDNKQFSWIPRLEAATSVIREEFLRTADTVPVTEYLRPETMTGTNKGWRTFFLVNPMGKQMVENQKLCSQTWEILNSLPGFIPSNMVLLQ